MNRIMIVRVDVGKMPSDKAKSYIARYRRELSGVLGRIGAETEVLFVPVRDGQVKGLEIEIVKIY